MGRHSDNARERVIDAAEQVVIEAGAGHLTFEAVASKAGVSRGGLLYHFPDKKALLRGMLDRRRNYMAEIRMKKLAEIRQVRSARPSLMYSHYSMRIAKRTAILRLPLSLWQRMILESSDRQSGKITIRLSPTSPGKDSALSGPLLLCQQQTG